jgi:hypothetical protein
MTDDNPGSGGAGERRRRVPPPPTIDLQATDLSPAPSTDAEAVRESADATMTTSPAQTAASQTPPPAGGAAPAFPWRLAAAGLIGAALGVVVVLIGWALAGGDRGDDNTRLSRIEAQLGTLARTGGAPADDKALGDLTQRLGRIEQALTDRLAAVDRELKPLADRLADLNRRNDEIVAATQVARERADAAAKSLADVAQQLATLNAERARAPQVERADLDALAGRLASLESGTKAIGEQLSRIANAAVAGNTRQAVLAIALNTAVERGAPYARELAAIDPAVAGAATLEALKPFAESGVPSPPALARELAALLPAARQAASGPPPSGFLDRLQANAERLVRIRPVGPAAGDDPGAVLARVDAKAAEGDIAGALDEASKLTATVRAPLAPWIRRAEERNAALAAASALALRSLDVIRRPAAAPAQTPATQAPATQGTR